MKKVEYIAQELSQALCSFGKSDQSQEIIKEAIAANSWFTATDICRSVEAIRTQMLDPEKLRAWLSHYPTTHGQSYRRIGIIMAGNIPLVGFFDLLCTIAAGCQAWVKPSSKDKVLMDYVCTLMREIDPSIPIYKYSEQIQYDAIIATGGTAANEYFQQRFKDTKRLCRGNRHSVAVLSGTETQEELQLLANDIYSYSGLGCRNVAMIFAPKGAKIEIPASATSQKYHNNYLQTKALTTMSGQHFVDNGASIIINSKEFPRTLSTISLWEYESTYEVEQWISEHDNSLQCIVSNIIEHPRRVDFGQAQHPTLFDYADGVDTMQFLSFD